MGTPNGPCGFSLPCQQTSQSDAETHSFVLQIESSDDGNAIVGQCPNGTGAGIYGESINEETTEIGYGAYGIGVSGVTQNGNAGQFQSSYGIGVSASGGFPLSSFGPPDPETTGIGVSASGPGIGVYATGGLGVLATDGSSPFPTPVPTGVGVLASGASVGIQASVTESGGVAVRGDNDGLNALGFIAGTDLVFSQHAGVYGQSDQQGVFGYSTSETGTGVYGNANGFSAFGVRGETDVGFGIQGQAFGTGIGVSGISQSGTGVYASSNGTAVQANASGGGVALDVANTGSGPAATVHIDSLENGNAALQVTTAGTGSALSVVNSNSQNASTTFWAQSSSYPGSGPDAADFFGSVDVDGDLNVAGSLTAFGKSFVIDHPLDPANKDLEHASVESSERATVYSGNVVLGDHGDAVVELPTWLEALCEDFRYQLTCVGGSAPVYVAGEVAGNQFRIGGGTAGLKVSWQLTGTRKDAWAKAHPLVVERDKPEEERGYYRHPELFGSDWQHSVAHLRAPKMRPSSDTPAARPTPGRERDKLGEATPRAPRGPAPG